jgi:hypothetical protein
MRLLYANAAYRTSGTCDPCEMFKTQIVRDIWDTIVNPQQVELHVDMTLTFTEYLRNLAAERNIDTIRHA